MDERIRIWNLLHDGEITAVEGEGTDVLRLFVSIPYLRRRLAPLGDSFVLTLRGVQSVSFEGDEGSAKSLGEEIEDALPVILSTSSEAMPLEIATTTGALRLDFQTLLITFDTGSPVAFAEIERVCEEYWNEWKAKNEAKRRDAGRS